MQTLSVKTDRRTQLVDVTAQVQKAVASSGVANGICYLYVPHMSPATSKALWTGWSPRRGRTAAARATRTPM
jgi:hypothetical protein